MKQMNNEARNDLVTFLKKLVVFIVFIFIIFRFVFGVCLIDHDLYVYDRLDLSYPTGEMVLYEQNGKRGLGEILPKTKADLQEDEIQILSEEERKEGVISRSAILGKAVLSIHMY